MNEPWIEEDIEEIIADFNFNSDRLKRLAKRGFVLNQDIKNLRKYFVQEIRTFKDMFSTHEEYKKLNEGLFIHSAKCMDNVTKEYYNYQKNNGRLN